MKTENRREERQALVGPRRQQLDVAEMRDVVKRGRAIQSGASAISYRKIMAQHVSTTTHEGIAVLEIDNPPVNALSTRVAGELAEALRRAVGDDAVDALVILCAGRTFVAGADIAELEAAARGQSSGPPDIHDLLAAIEDAPKPVVMAMHGTALGGGLELAMAGHYRVASPGARMGMPEVMLGIIPGAEGTQRLPRLVGIEKAIALCVSGKPIGATDALQAGLIDDLVDGDLRSGALVFARDAVRRGGPLLKTRDRRERLGTPQEAAALAAAGRDLARKTHPRRRAPIAAVDAIEAAASLPFAEGCRLERSILTAQMGTVEARASMYAFFAERAAAKGPRLPAEAQAADIRRVAIVGAGTMGGGIAMACANAGLEVALMDAGAEQLDRGMETVRRNYSSSVKRGRLSEAEVDGRLRRIRPLEGYEGCADADLVIEAVFESLDLKVRVFEQIDRLARPGAVLATNTSTLDVDRIASATSRPHAVVGLHFFSPAHVMRLLEIVRGRSTGPDTLATALSVARRLGKAGVVVGNGPGFVGNRLMFPYMYEAQFLVEDGATPEQVDRVLTDWGMAMGIFAVDDMSGLDVAWRVRQELGQFQEPGARRPLVADELVAMGRLGQKTGKGWYRYDGGRTPLPDPDVTALIERTAASAGIARRQVSDAEILERTIYALINEGARVLEEGVAARAADIDVIYLTGYGFPRDRGGPMFHADTMGLPVIYERVAGFERALGPRWSPAPLLARLAGARPGEPRTFREIDELASGDR
jgi:3-hydroxyacyl-CoA dehydrogenase